MAAEETMIGLCRRARELDQHRNISDDGCDACPAALEHCRRENVRLRAERDEARKWARYLLTVWRGEHWVRLHFGDDDGNRFAALAAERDALQAQLAEALNANEWPDNSIGDGGAWE